MNRSSSGEASRGPAPAAVEETGKTDSRLLERVLLETASAPEQATAKDEDWQALLDVARRHAGATLAVEPVLVEMVAALLRLRIGKSATPVEVSRPMVERIAATMFDDRPTHERLESLWARLCEAAL